MSKEKETKTAEETEAMTQEVETASTAKETLEAVDKRYGPLGFDITPYIKCKL